MVTFLKRSRRRLADLFATLGGRSAILYLIDRGCAKLNVCVRARSYDLVVQPVAAGPRLSPRRASGFEIRLLGAGDPALTYLPVSEATRRYRLDQGALCVAVFRHDRLAAYGWLCLNGYDEDEVSCRFVPQPEQCTAWDFDVHVLPDFRGSLAFLALWDAMDAQLRAHGRSVSLSRISRFNRASVHSHMRLGAHCVGRADFIRVGRWQLHWARVGGKDWRGVSRKRAPLVPLPVELAKGGSRTRKRL